MVPVWLEGSDTLQVILDTGMPIVGIYVFHEDFAESLDPEEAMEVRVPGAGSGEASTALLFDSLTVNVGGMPIPGQMVLVSRSETTQGFPRGGVIGKTLFGSYAVEIDYDESVLRLHDPADYSLDTTWTPIPIVLRKDIPFLEASIAVAGEDEVPVTLYIDLASEEALELLVKPDMKFPVPEDAEERYIGTGLSGDITGKLGLVDSLRIGPFVLYDVPAEFAAAKVRSKQEGADGILADDALRRFNVVLDNTNQVMYLKPNRAYRTPFEME
jgi:hypothetical protein